MKERSEEGGRGHWLKNAGSLQRLEKSKKQTLPRASRRNTACQYLDRSPVRSIL